MTKILYMPEVLANTTHATINRWLVQVGDKVEEGQVIAEVETDKALIDMLAEESAIISLIIANEGEEVAVGAPIAQLNGSGVLDNDLLHLVSQADAIETKEADTSSKDKSSIIQEEKDFELGMDRATSQEGKLVRIFASPLARRLAKINNLSLEALKGSGPNGRIIKRDIEKALNQQSTLQKNKSVPSEVQQQSIEESSYEVIPLSSMRKTIARRLSESKQTIPHFYLTVDCNVDGLLQLRQELNGMAIVKISVNDLIVKAAGLALKEVPEMNASFEVDKIYQYHQADISIAVATENGIQTPIVRAVETKSIGKIHQEVSDLAGLARESRLMPHQYQGGGFSISNLGMYGVDSFSAIINPPQAGILAVGTVRKVPVVINGELQESSVISCTLSVDHRVVDGAKAAQWLASFRKFVESPLSLLL